MAMQAEIDRISLRYTGKMPNAASGVVVDVVALLMMIRELRTALGICSRELHTASGAYDVLEALSKDEPGKIGKYLPGLKRCQQSNAEVIAVIEPMALP